MAAGDINDPLSEIPGIALADSAVDPTDLGAGFALLKLRDGQLIWLPTGGAVTRALDDQATGQLATLTEEASPASADLLLLEKASGGAKRKVQVQNLPGGGEGGGYYDAYVRVVDTKASGTDGGTATSGAWRTRDLNTVTDDPQSIASLATNEVTLPAATYDCSITSPFYYTDNAEIRLYNVTGAASLLRSPQVVTGINAGVDCTIHGRITLAVESAVRVEYQVTTTRATLGLGTNADWSEPAIYTVAEFRRLAA